jgi:hypothetical protein
MQISASESNIFFFFLLRVGASRYLVILERLMKSHNPYFHFFNFTKEYIHQGKCPLSLIRFDVWNVANSQKSVFLFA